MGLNVLTQIFGRMEAWFASIKIYINSPTIIYNLSKAIEQSDDINIKSRVRDYNEEVGLEDAFNKVLKEKGWS